MIIDLIRADLSYCKSGILINNSNRSRTAKKGKRAGYINKTTGYRRVGFHGKVYGEHQLIWMYFNGPIRRGYEIDHINGDKVDNRIENLRCVTHSENMKNCKLYSNNSTGVTGVGFHKSTGKWRARRIVNGVENHLGLFDNKGDAIDAIKQWETL